jgi:hypothetical protein
MLFGRGIAFDHAASSAIHTASSSKMGAPWAAFTLGLHHALSLTFGEEADQSEANHGLGQGHPEALGGGLPSVRAFVAIA